ncbi:SPRY domain-containing SOCS box protein 3-like [Anastrepha ludens]|uniref:SPRY domain-containing SOCS box protein 3-like n=1 Tax=Anastrepha ludens TaxID=28586 RepID=UPI0023B12858|nr:SPRY domain-containing SOCS box protein 3-like [Anastrepha ludens]
MYGRHPSQIDLAPLPMTPFCRCFFTQSRVICTFQGLLPTLIRCRCGERTEKREKRRSRINKEFENIFCEPSGVEWGWARDEISGLRVSGNDVIFPYQYNSGTVIVRSERELEVGMVHFWEMRILTPLEGSDVIFGIGTDKINPHQFPLGLNAESWGLSFYGRKQHNGRRAAYSPMFSQGCVVGICLDRSRGTLEFYLNRRSLGVAYRNIPCDPQVKLYAMVSSTSTRSAIRLMNSTSQKDCLQLRTVQALSNRPKDLKLLHKIPGYKILLRIYWFFLMPPPYTPIELQLISNTWRTNLRNMINELYDWTD